MKTEPAIIITTVSGFISAALGCAVAFGANFSDSQQRAVLAVTAAFVALILAIGPAIRQFVYAPNSVAKKVQEAASKGALGETQTPVVP